MAAVGAWTLAGDHALDHGTDAGRPLVIDVDAALVTAHSQKEGSAPTFKKGFGHHRLWASTTDQRHRRAAGGAAAPGQRRLQ